MIDRVTVAEAAQRLGVSEGAIRQRIFRDTIKHEKDSEGRVYVYLTPNDTQDSTVNDSVKDTVKHELIEELRDRVRFLEEELSDRKEESRRKDSIIMSLTQRIPELEAAPEPRESAVSDSEATSKGAAVPQDSADGQIKAPWWKRLFQ